MTAIKLGLLFIVLFFLPSGLQSSFMFYRELINDEPYMHIKFLNYLAEISPVAVSLIIFSLSPEKLERLFPQRDNSINSNIDHLARIAVFGLAMFYAALIFYKSASLSYIIAEGAITGYDNRQVIAGMSIEILAGLTIIFVSFKYHRIIINRFFEKNA